MLSNYLRVSFRNLRRHKGYSFINIAGLATGMAAFVLIALYVQNEMSFDRHVDHRDDIYRVILDARVGDQEMTVAVSPAAMAGAFMETFPEVVDAVRIDKNSADALFTIEDRAWYESGFFLADSSVFEMFSIPLVEGDPATALNRPNTLVLSESVARRVFGDGSALGQTIRYDHRIDYEITGVMADPPPTAHFRPYLLGSFLTNPRWQDPLWTNNSFYTYIRLREGSDPAALEAKFPDFMRIHVGPEIRQFTGQDYDQAIAAGMRYDWPLERLSEIYLHSRARDQVGQTGDIRYLYVLGIIALFVLLIACVNFMNLSTARATGRALEVSVRKVLGSDRSRLITQFLGESVFMALLSMFLAMGIVALVLPYFSGLAGAELHFAPWLVWAILATALFTGVVAGLYPAFVLSSFRPAIVLKGSRTTGRHGIGLRRALVVVQFTISITLLVGTTVVYEQLRFIRGTELGFDAEQVIVLQTESSEGVSFETFRSEILAAGPVVAAASSGILPGPDRIHNHTSFRAEGMRTDEFFVAGLGDVSSDFVETLELEMVAGRDFDPDFPSDSSAWVVNEATAARMGWSPEEAIGRELSWLGNDTRAPGTIIGVTANAHFASLHQVVEPIVFGHSGEDQFYVPVRIQADRAQEALEAIQSKWEAFQPGYPFRYFFMDSDYARFYEREQRLGNLYLDFTILAVLIACLGLFGLASFVASQRKREIGLRKALGASVGGIVLLLSREFTLLVLVACGLAFPIAWYAMSRWLEGFAYATSIGWGVFVLAGGSALAIAWLTVSWQSIRAALTNPVEALHNE